MNKIFGRIIGIFFITTVIYEIISIWLGLVYFPPTVLFLFSFILSILILKLHPLDLSFPLKIWIIGFIFILILALPTLVFNSGVSASSDAFQTIMVRTIQNKIPKNFSPYSSLPFVYPFGFHLFAKAITNILFFIPDYRVLWMLGLVYIFMLPALIYNFFRLLLKNNSFGFWAAVFVFGNKIYLSNFFYGIYPELLGICLFLFSAVLYQYSYILFLGCLGALFVIHPISAVMGILFWSLYFFIHKKYKQLFTLPLTALFSIPALSTYLLAGGTIIHPAPGITSFMAKGMMPWNLFNWIGPFLSLIFLVALVYFFIQRKKIHQSVLNLIKVLLIMGGIVLAFIYFTPLYPWKMVHVLSFVFIGIACIGAGLMTKKFSRNKTVLLSCLLIIIFIGTIFLSKTLRSLYFGEKISKREIKASLEFSKVIPKKSRVIFLSHDFTTSSAMMGMLTDTIPYGLDGYFLPEDPPQLNHPAYLKNKMEQSILKKVVDEKCIFCIELTDAKYIVVNKDKFNYELPYLMIKKYDKFFLYKIIRPEGITQIKTTAL